MGMESRGNEVKPRDAHEEMEQVTGKHRNSAESGQ